MVELIQPERPAPEKLAPVFRTECFNGSVSQVSRELFDQRWTDSLIGLLKGLAQWDRYQAETGSPAFEGFSPIGSQALQWWWWGVEISC